MRSKLLQLAGQALTMNVLRCRHKNLVRMRQCARDKVRCRKRTANALIDEIRSGEARVSVR
ncbi:hypothetical protein WK68_20485 [Burkholderia ubonensis]|nr:hypothetical protein WK68_20485 [Burkholderia ubonensis]